MLFFDESSMQKNQDVFPLLKHMNNILIVIFLAENTLTKIFSFNNIYYITKPISENKLNDIILECKKRFSEKNKSVSEIDKIIVKKNNRYYLLDLNCILYFQAYGSEIKIVTDKNNEYHVNHPLCFWEKHLKNKCFYRCHKGYLVNLKKIVEIVPYYNSTFLLLFENSKNTVPVGRAFIKQFKEELNW